jgi:FXSXX-COOH protein
MSASTTSPDLAEVGTELADLSGESLAALRTSASPVLSHAIQRASEEAKTGPDVSASFESLVG